MSARKKTPRTKAHHPAPPPVVGSAEALSRLRESIFCAFAATARGPQDPLLLLNLAHAARATTDLHGLMQMDGALDGQVRS